LAQVSSGNVFVQELEKQASDYGSSMNAMQLSLDEIRRQCVDKEAKLEQLRATLAQYEKREVRTIDISLKEKISHRLVYVALKLIVFSHFEPDPVKQHHQPTRSLRSSSSHQLFIPQHNLSFGSRVFRFSAPQIWNSLPLRIRESQSLPAFKHHLKTHFFQSAYPTP